jgi:hypothetical protein
VFERLEFIYLPSRDVVADVIHYTHGLGGEVAFAIEAFGTRVAPELSSRIRGRGALRCSS